MEAASAILRSLPSRRAAARFERECEELRKLGERYLAKHFDGTLSRADAEDAVSDVLIRLHCQIEAGRGPRNLRAAFFTSVRNAAIDELRSRAIRPTVPLDVVAEAPTSNPTPAELAEIHEDAVRLTEALGRMRGNYREVIVLRFGRGFKAREIADHFGVSMPAARKLLLRATRQVRIRLESIDAAEFCPEMQQLASRSLFDREASGLASEAEERILHTHFQHCGSCRAFLTRFHENLHELGGSLGLVGLATDQVAARVGVIDRLQRWFGAVAHAAQGTAAKLRLVAFKSTGALQPSDGGSAGALAGSAQKIAAVCTAGVATTATCLATGIVGPGIGISAPPPSPTHHSPAPKVKTVSEPISQPPVSTPSPTPAPESKASPAPEPNPDHANESSHPQSTPAAPPAESPPSETPAQQGETQFGIESSSPPSTETAASAPASTGSSPSSSSAGSSSGSAAGKSGTESFGFHG